MGEKYKYSVKATIGHTPDVEVVRRAEKRRREKREEYNLKNKYLLNTIGLRGVIIEVWARSRRRVARMRSMNNGPLLSS